MQLPNRMESEAAFARRMARMTSRHRAQLRDYLGNPPNVNNVPETFWREIEEDTKRETLAVLYLLFLNSSFYHASGDMTGAGLSDLMQQQLEREATAYSDQRSLELATGYVATSHDRFNDLATEIRQKQSSGIEITRGEIEDEITRIFGPDRATNIAMTETTKAQTGGGEAGARYTFGITVDDTWNTKQDGKVCPKCEPLNGQPRSVWAQIFPSGPGDDAHVNCRCWLTYANRVDQLPRRFVA